VTNPFSVVDSREPLWLRQDLAESLHPLRLGSAALETGDYWYYQDEWKGPTVIVERKTIGDFLTSMADGRLDRQLKRAAELAPVIALLLEGSWETCTDQAQSYLSLGSKRKSGWRPQHLLGKISGLQRRMPSMILLPSPGRKQTVTILTCIGRGQLESLYLPPFEETGV
jgi:ERCC4-type nuclease